MKLRLVFFIGVLFVLSCSKKQTDIVAPNTPPNSIPTTPVITNNVAPEPIGDNSEASDGNILINQDTVSRFTKRVWQGIPSIVADKNDVLYTVWYTGGPYEGRGNYITLSISYDHGNTWLKNKLIISPTDGTDVRFYDPTIWKDNMGNIYVSWTKSHGFWDGKGGVWYSSIKNVDNTIKFSPPRRLSDGVMMNKPVVSYNNQNTFFPIALWTLSPTLPLASGVFIYKATNNNTFNIYTDFKKFVTVPFTTSLRTYDEHMIVQLKNGSYMVLLRGADGTYIARSADAINWEPTKKFTLLGATTGSRFFFGRLKSGRLVVVMNNSTDRSKMSLFLSNDEGTTWNTGFMIDQRLNTSYPDLTQDNSGRIYVTYDYDRYGVGNIIVASFTEYDALYNNTQNIKFNIVSALK